MEKTSHISNILHVVASQLVEKSVLAYKVELAVRNTAGIQKLISQFHSTLLRICSSMLRIYGDAYISGISSIQGRAL